MTTMTSRAMLPPARQKIGVFGNYLAQQDFNTLVLKEKVMSLSGDSFDIRMKETGQPIIKVQGELIGSKKTATDSESGQHLWTLGREYMHLHTTYALKDATGATVMEVQSRLFTRECSPCFCLLWAPSSPWSFLFRFFFPGTQALTPYPPCSPRRQSHSNHHQPCHRQDHRPQAEGQLPRHQR